MGASMFTGSTTAFFLMRFLGNVHEWLLSKIDNSLSGSTNPAFMQCLASVAQQWTAPACPGNLL
jgi:hypothetical protein